MKQKSFKKIIMIVIIAIVIIIGLIVYLMEDEESNTEVEEENTVITTVTVETVTEDDYEEFYTISECVNTYLSNLNIENYSYYGYNSDGDYEKITSDEEINENIYNLLSKEYIEENGITLDNLREKIDVFEKTINFTLLNMSFDSQDTVDKYVVYGILTDIDINLVDEFYAFVNIDSTNNTFSIEPIDDEYTDIDDIEIINKNESIEENDNNEITSVEITNVYLAEQYFEKYTILMLTYPKLAYEYLDEEYRANRFEGYDEFKEYIDEREYIIESSIVYKYDVEDETITVVDINNNVYIFKILNLLDFSVQLDDYTIKSDAFIEEYESSTDEEKVQTDINIFFEMINMKDYSAAYEILTDEFKANYFETLDDFEEYAQNNLFENTRVIDFGEVTETESNYSCTVETSSGSSSISESGEETFIVSLGEGTDFELSFTVKE